MTALRRVIQQAKCANGITATVNFGEKSCRLADDKKMGRTSYSVSGM